MVTPALEHIVEDNTLLSGLGFECGGLPICLADIGMHEPTDEELMLVDTRAFAAGETIHNDPYEITAIRIMHASKSQMPKDGDVIQVSADTFEL